MAKNKIISITGNCIDCGTPCVDMINVANTSDPRCKTCKDKSREKAESVELVLWLQEKTEGKTVDYDF